MRSFLIGEVEKLKNIFLYRFECVLGSFLRFCGGSSFT